MVKLRRRFWSTIGSNLIPQTVLTPDEVDQIPHRSAAFSTALANEIPQLANLTMTIMVIILQPRSAGFCLLQLMNKRGKCGFACGSSGQSAPRLQQTQNKNPPWGCWRGQASTAPRWANQALPIHVNAVPGAKARLASCSHMHALNGRRYAFWEGGDITITATNSEWQLPAGGRWRDGFGILRIGCQPYEL